MGFAKQFKKVEVASDVAPTRWINDDIKPIEFGRRTWGMWAFNNFWILINANISTYLSGSALIPLGLNWWQAIIAIIFGNIFASMFVVVNSLPGAYYHIGFSVANRYVWGMYGSQFIIWNRILLSLGTYLLIGDTHAVLIVLQFGMDFKPWVGGECFYIILMSLDPRIEQHIPNTMAENTGVTTAQFLAYILFMLISLPFIWIRPHKLERFMSLSGMIVVGFMIVLLIWSLSTMGPAGFGTTISSSEAVESATPVSWLMIYGIISTIGAISAGILNQNDMARFARRPKDAIAGQIFSFPLYSCVTSIIGILVTAATQNRFGAALWNLPDIFTTMILQGGSRERAAGFFAGLALVVSQIGVNVPGNALSGGCDLAATFPKYINIRRGAYLTAVFSIVVNPWRLVSTSTTFLSVLSSYAVFLGPTIGMMIASYFVVNRSKINIDDLFVGDKRSIYWFSYGINWRAIVAWILGVVPSFPGFLASVNTGIEIPTGFTNLYYLCFLTGSSIAGIVLAVLHFIFPAPSLQTFVNSSSSSTELMAKYQNKWDTIHGAIIVGESRDDNEVRVSDDQKL